jgi:hypothetical protein
MQLILTGRLREISNTLANMIYCLITQFRQKFIIVNQFFRASLF